MGRVLRELRGALRNRSFRAIFVGLVVFFVMRGVQTALNLHMGTYFWRITSDEILAVTLAVLVGFVVGLPVWALTSRRLDKKPTFLIGVSGFSGCVLVPPVLEIQGWFFAHTSPWFLGTLIGASLLGAFFGAAGLVTAGSMLADIADEHELTTGRRQEGIFFGANAFAAKSASGIGHQVAGLGLDAIRFPTQLAPGVMPDPEVVRGLGILAGPGVGVLALVALAVLAGYRLDRHRHAEIALALDRRRAGETGSVG